MYTTILIILHEMQLMEPSPALIETWADWRRIWSLGSLYL